MGYSCTAAAGCVLDAVTAVAAPRDKEGKRPSNGLPGGGFWEIGRENADGAVTGTVWRNLNAQERARWSHLDNLDERVTRAGGFRIEPCGHISRFPGLPKDLREAAERTGKRRYQKTYAG
jgi:hypothetical protein